MPSDARGVGGRSVRAGAVSLVGQAVRTGAAVVAVMVLARLLTPDDFGVLAVAVACFAFASLLRDAGLPMAAVQARDLDDDAATALFWVQVTLGIVVGLLTGGLGFALAAWFDDARLASALLWIAAAVALGGLGAQHEARLRRELRFGPVAAVETAALVLGFGAAIVAALAGAGYHALVLQHAVTALAKTALLWLAMPWRPGRWPGRAALGDLVAFGKDVTRFRMASTIGEYLDLFLVSGLHGATAAGLYGTASRYAQLPVRQLYPALIGVAVAGLSKVRTEADRYRRYFRRGIAPVAALIVPTLVCALALAEEVVLVLLGDQWGDAVPLFRALLVASLAGSVMRLAKWVFMAEGRTATLRRWGYASNAVLVIAMLVAAPFSPLVLAMTVAVARLVMVWPTLLACVAGSPLTLGDFGAVLARPSAASAVAGVTVAALAGVLPEGLVGLVVGTLGFAAICAAVWVTLPGGRRSLRDLAALPARIAQPDTM